MVKFEVIVAPPVALTVQHRTVCDVTEYRYITELGKVISWRGSLNEEYFSILFAKGLLAVSISENEIYLGYNSLHYALTEKAFAISNNSVDATNKYSIEDVDKDIEKMTFVDVLIALNWRYAPNVKVWHDMLGD